MKRLRCVQSGTGVRYAGCTLRRIPETHVGYHQLSSRQSAENHSNAPAAAVGEYVHMRARGFTGRGRRAELPACGATPNRLHP